MIGRVAVGYSNDTTARRICLTGGKITRGRVIPGMNRQPFPGSNINKPRHTFDPINPARYYIPEKLTNQSRSQGSTSERTRLSSGERAPEEIFWIYSDRGVDRKISIPSTLFRRPSSRGNRNPWKRDKVIAVQSMKYAEGHAGRRWVRAGT